MAARVRIAVVAVAVMLMPAAAARAEEKPQPKQPSGDAVIRAAFDGSEIVITTTSRLAGAVHSLTWNGKEFIDSVDHGRQLQSACSFDCGRAGPFHAECYNPTEAGGRIDGAGPKSTSRLLEIRAEGAELSTKIQMAFWVPPGEKTEGKPALNDKLLSDHVIAKRVRIGVGGRANVIAYDVTFTVPASEDKRHTLAQFESLTGYMPTEFSRFLRHDAAAGRLVPLGDGPGEQRDPVVLSTENGSHAMGILSPDTDRKPGFGRFRFAPQRVVKWNCVFRVRDKAGVPAGDYSYRHYVIVGTLADVEATMTSLRSEIEKR
jgi:hypothetical protein